MVVAFDPSGLFGAGPVTGHLAMGDLDGDGLPDVVITSNLNDAVSVLRNISQ